MNSLVLFRSSYGHAEQYAQWLGEELSASPLDLTDHRPMPLVGADCAVFVLPVYAAKLIAMKQVAQLAKAAPEVPLVIATVSMSDLNTATGTREQVLAASKKALGSAVFDRVQWFHLRGGIDYSKLTLKHRLMMFGTNMLMRRRAAKGDVGAKHFVAGYGKSVDLSDRSMLDPVLELVRTMSKADRPEDAASDASQ